MRRHLTIGAAAIALAFAGCGGDEEKATTNPAPPDSVETTPPPSDPSTLPPEFVECMAEQGYDVGSSDDIHSAPPEVLQACFGSIHGGGGAP